MNDDGDDDDDTLLKAGPGKWDNSNFIYVSIY